MKARSGSSISITCSAVWGTKCGFHPEVPDVSHQPDFEARRGDQRLYVEAAVVFSGIVDEEADPVREAWIMEAVNKASNPHFHVGITFEARGKQRPRARDIIRPLEEWLESLDPDDVRAYTEAVGPPVKRIVVDEWQMLFDAVAAQPEARGDRTGSVAICGLLVEVTGWHLALPRLGATSENQGGAAGREQIAQSLSGA